MSTDTNNQSNTGIDTDKKLEDQYKKDLQEYKKVNEELQKKSQDDFEKQLSFISAGTLTLSMFLMEKVVSLKTAQCKSILICSWVFLGGTLILNLISHLVSGWYNDLNIKMIDEENYNPTKITQRNNNMNVINIVTLICLIIGIVFLIIFMSINI